MSARLARRWTRCPFPAYAYRPGRHPHPRRSPDGHSYGSAEPVPAAFAPESWRTSSDYLYALDLFHAGYWWESHELLEGLWFAFGRSSAEGRLMKALVLAAAAELQRACGHGAASRRLALRAAASLAGLPPRLLGVDVPRLAAALRIASRALAPPALEIPVEASAPAGS